MRAETGIRRTVSWIITLFFSVLNIAAVLLIITKSLFRQCASDDR